MMKEVFHVFWKGSVSIKCVEIGVKSDFEFVRVEDRSQILIHPTKNTIAADRKFIFISTQARMS